MTAETSQFVLGNGDVVVSKMSFISSADKHTFPGIEIEEVSQSMGIGEIPQKEDMDRLLTGRKVQIILLNLESARVLQKMLELAIDDLNK